MSSKDLDACFRDLFERNHPRWTGVARAYAHASESEDLLQEIVMQVWRSLASFEGRSRIDTWAYRIALNTALGWQRSSRTRVNTQESSSNQVGDLAGTVESDSESMRVLHEFLAALSKTDRAVMLLYLDNVSNPEAAEITGLTEGAIRVRLHRIRKRFESSYCEGGATHEI
jgi:RNA polymerase sigma-70 factor (ECF subfamily)